MKANNVLHIFIHDNTWEQPSHKFKKGHFLGSIQTQLSHFFSSRYSFISSIRYNVTKNWLKIFGISLRFGSKAIQCTQLFFSTSLVFEMISGLLTLPSKEMRQNDWHDIHRLCIACEKSQAPKNIYGRNDESLYYELLKNTLGILISVLTNETISDKARKYNLS